jgi:hypothetical protein
MDPATRAMRYAAAIADRLWTVIERERLRLDKVENQMEAHRGMIVNLIVDTQERDEAFGKRFQSHSDRAGRHRNEINKLVEHFGVMERRMELLEMENMDMKVRMESLADKACHCGDKTPVSWRGRGTVDEPLEYDDDEAYNTPLVASPDENTAPLPVPPPCCRARSPPADRPLVPIQEDDKVSTAGVGCLNQH